MAGNIRSPQPERRSASMDIKKFLLAALAVFVAYSALGYLIHNIILAGDYEPLVGTTLRTAEGFTQRLPMLYLANLIFALAFCLIYTRGYERGKGWLGQGVRYGLLVGTLLAPVALIEYVVYPVAGALALKWIFYGYLQVVVCGVATAGLYRPQS
jgi:hypothetical protein